MASTLVVEDGTGKTDADAYVSAADATAYHVKHGSPAAWTAATEAQKDAAIRAATVYLDAKMAWVGVVANDDQSLGWPRAEAYDSEGREQEWDIVPQRVEDACSYLALVHLSSALDATQARGGDIKREKVGAVEVEYMDRAVPGTALPFVRQIVGGLAQSSASTVNLFRA